MHGSHHRVDDEPMAEMNLIPLIDIALTLLIIMMVTTAFIRKPGVSLHLPKTVTREGAPEAPKDLTIVVAPDGGYYVDGQRVDEGVVRARLHAVAEKDVNSRVLVKGDQDVRFGDVMGVMDMARQERLTHVVFPTEPKRPTAPLPTAAPAPSGGGTAVQPAAPARPRTAARP